MAAKTEGGFTNRVDALKQTVEEVVRTTKKLIMLARRFKVKKIYYLFSCI